MAVVVGRMLAILEAQTAQFEARMNAAGQQLSRWTSTTGSAHRGTALLRTGLQQLAFEGLGMMPPALSRVSAGMLTLVGPGGVLLAAVAVLGAVSLAFERAGKKAEEFVAEANRVREFRLEHLKMLAGIGGPAELTPQEELGQLLQQRLGVITQIAALRRQLPGEDLLGQLGIGGPNARNAAADIDALTIALRNLNRQIDDMAREAGNEAPFFLLLRRGAGFQPGAFGPSPIRSSALASGHFINDPFANVSTMFGRGDTPAVQPKQPGFQFNPQVAQLLLFSLMSARSGGAGGALMGLGGLAGSLSGMQGIAGHAAAGPLGWVGFGLSALGSIFTSNADKNAQKIVDAINHLGQEVGLERVTVVFTGPDGHQIRKTLAELEESDAVERVPGPVGAQG